MTTVNWSDYNQAQGASMFPFFVLVSFICSTSLVCACVWVCDKKRNHQNCVILCRYGLMVKSNYFRFNGKGDFDGMNDGKQND